VKANLICKCGHKKFRHEEETYSLVAACLDCKPGYLYSDIWMHEFKPDNLRFLESLSE